MKRKIICLAAAIGFMAIGCNETDDGSFTEPISLYEKIDGEWSLMNLKMVDDYAKANNLQPNEQNLSTLFNYDTFKIRFNVDERNQPTTYEVLGNVPPLFQLTGYWSLSSAFQQTNGDAIRIYLYSDAQRTQKADELRLTGVPGSTDEMEFQLVRTSGGTPFVSYVFKVNATN